MPKELGGPGNAANPETFFASGYSACFQGALGLVARNQKVTLPEGNTVTVTIGIGKDETSFGLNAKISVKLPGMARSEERRVGKGWVSLGRHRWSPKP